jgi:hypothetical protein
MADKESTAKEKETTVEPEREYYVPDYGITVKARSAAEAVEVAKKAAKQDS